MVKHLNKSQKKEMQPNQEIRHKYLTLKFQLALLVQSNSKLTQPLFHSETISDRTNSIISFYFDRLPFHLYVY